MTLNITVFDDRIYQSADFRLTEQPSGRLKTDSSMKAITIQNSEYMGLLTYTGVGRVKDKDTREWILEWLVETGDGEFDEVVAGLAERASAWLKQISPVRKPYALTLVLGTFRADGSDARVTVISNFEDASGRTRAASLPMSVSVRSAGARPKVIITGWKPAVSRQRRRWLERVCRRHWNEPQRIRQAMTDTKPEAAASPRSNKTISPECTVVTMVRDGSGAQTMNPADAVDFRGIMFGQVTPDVHEIMRDLGIPAGVLRSSSFARAPGSASSTDRAIQRSWVSPATDLIELGVRRVEPRGPVTERLGFDRSVPGAARRRGRTLDR